MAIHSAKFEVINSNSTTGNSFAVIKSNDELLEEYSLVHSGHSDLPSSLAHRFNGLINSPFGFSKSSSASKLNESLMEDKNSLTTEEVGIIRRFKDFLIKLRCPLELQGKLNETFMIYKEIERSLGLLGTVGQKSVNTSASVDILLKAMILSLFQNNSLMFATFAKVVQSKLSWKSDNISKLLDLNIMALFMDEINFDTFKIAIEAFSNIYSDEERFLMAPISVPNALELTEYCDKYDYMIELFFMKLQKLIFESDISTLERQTFISIYFKFLCRNGRFIVAEDFLMQIAASVNLPQQDSFLMALIAAEYDNSYLFDLVLKHSGPDLSLILSNQFILNRMKNYFIQNLPNISQIRLSPHNFNPKSQLLSMILAILGVNSSFEEIVSHFIAWNLFDQLDTLFNIVDLQLVDVASISAYLIRTNLSSYSYYQNLILKSLPLPYFNSFLKRILEYVIPNPVELNEFIARILLELPSTYYTSWAVSGIVNLSTGLCDLLNFVLQYRFKPVIELICAFYRIETTYELINDGEAAHRRITFIDDDFVQVFDKFNNSFEIILP